MRVKSYWIGVYGQVRALQKRFMRDGTSLFFTFLFPLIFLLVFGAIFNNQTTSFDVAIINHSKSEFAKQFVEQAKANKDTTLKVKDVKDMQEAREKLKHSELSGIIELPADFGTVTLARVAAKRCIVKPNNLTLLSLDRAAPLAKPTPVRAVLCVCSTPRARSSLATR